MPDYHRKVAAGVARLGEKSLGFLQIKTILVQARVPSPHSGGYGPSRLRSVPGFGFLYEPFVVERVGQCVADGLVVQGLASRIEDDPQVPHLRVVINVNARVTLECVGILGRRSIHELSVTAL